MNDNDNDTYSWDCWEDDRKLSVSATAKSAPLKRAPQRWSLLSSFHQRGHHRAETVRDLSKLPELVSGQLRTQRLTKVYMVKAMVFPGIMYGCESWTIKKAECRRIDAFELWCWRRLLRVPWTARRSSQSIKAPIIWPSDVKSQLIRKDPDAGKD